MFLISTCLVISRYSFCYYKNLSSAHPQMALLRDFCVERHDLNPQNSLLFLRFKSDARLELTQYFSSVDRHYLKNVFDKNFCAAITA